MKLRGRSFSKNLLSTRAFLLCIYRAFAFHIFFPQIPFTRRFFRITPNFIMLCVTNRCPVFLCPFRNRKLPFHSCTCIGALWCCSSDLPSFCKGSFSVRKDIFGSSLVITKWIAILKRITQCLEKLPQYPHIYSNQFTFANQFSMLMRAKRRWNGHF